MRVALPWLGYACGTCKYCNSGRETLCMSQLNMGYAINGGFAEYALGYARHVVRVPGRRRPAGRRAADLRRRHDLQGREGLRGALVGPRGGLRRRRPRPPRRPVRAASPARRSSRSMSTRRGWRRRASSAPSTWSTPPRRTRSRRSSASAAPTPRSPPRSRPKPFQQAYRSLARGGKLVCVGLPAENHMEIPIFETVLGALEVRGSIVGTRHDLEEVFELHRRGLTTVEYEERHLARGQRRDRAGPRRQRPRAADRLRHDRDQRAGQPLAARPA